MVDRKKILLTIPLGMSARNILRTDVYRILRDNYQVVILSKLSRNKQFVSEFASPNITFHDMPSLDGWKALLRAKLQELWTFHYGKTTGSETLRRHRERLKIENKIGYISLFIQTSALGKLRLWGPLRRLTQGLILHHHYYSEILDRENPDLVMSLSPLVTEEDLLVMSVARNEKIPVVGFVHSWDNIPKESNLWVMPDKLIVWNDIMREQAKRFLGFSGRDVFIGGIPQYDEYLFKTPILTQSEYKSQKGIPLNRKIITYSGYAPYAFPDEEEFIEDLVALIDQKVLGDATLIIRLHPIYNIEKYKRVFSNRPNVFLDDADAASAASAATYITDWPEYNGIPPYVSLLKNSDVFVNLASTVTLDAAIFDKPVVNVAYDMKPVRAPWLSIARFYETTHYKHITASSGVRIAYSRDELINYIKMYLEDPSIDREGRKRIVAEQCYKLDGRAGERVVNLIKGMIG